MGIFRDLFMQNRQVTARAMQKSGTYEFQAEIWYITCLALIGTSMTLMIVAIYYVKIR